MPPKKRRPVNVLTNLRIDEISAVDKGAGEGVEIMLLKRDDQNAAFAKLMNEIFEVKPRKKRKRWGYAMPDTGKNKNLDVTANIDEPIGGYQQEPADRTQALSENVERDEDDDRDDDESTDNDGADQHGAPTKHLNNLPDQLKKKQTMRDLRKVKSLDAIAICKTMAADGDAYSISEHDLVDLISNYAKAHGTTFAKLFERNDDTGIALRKAVDIAKNAQWLSRTTTLTKTATLTPRVTGGRAAMDIGNSRDVLDDIQKLVAEQQRQHPELSQAQAFARVYEDPANKDLASRERAQNRPVATW
jgi:hypothetical protein